MVITLVVVSACGVGSYGEGNDDSTDEDYCTGEV